MIKMNMQCTGGLVLGLAYLLANVGETRHIAGTPLACLRANRLVPRVPHRTRSYRRDCMLPMRWQTPCRSVGAARVAQKTRKSSRSGVPPELAPTP